MSVLDEHPGPAGLAREGGGGLGFQIELLYGEHGQCDAQQHHGHGRGAGLVIGAGDLQVDGGGQRVVGAADDHGVGEVRDGLDERHQKGVAQTRQHQRKGHAGEHLPAAGAHVPGGLLQGGIDVFQQALEHHVADGEEGQRLHDDDAPVAVDAVVIYAQQKPGDDAGLAEEHDHGQGQHEGRRHHRQHGDDLEQAAGEPVHADIDLHIGEKETHQGGEDAHHEAHPKGVGDRLDEGGHGEDPVEVRQAEAAVAHKAVHQQDGQRIEDKEGQKGDQHDDGGDHDGIGHQFLPIQRRALALCHGIRPFLSAG